MEEDPVVNYANKVKEYAEAVYNYGKFLSEEYIENDLESPKSGTSKDPYTIKVTAVEIARDAAETAGQKTNDSVRPMSNFDKVLRITTIKNSIDNNLTIINSIVDEKKPNRKKDFTEAFNTTIKNKEDASKLEETVSESYPQPVKLSGIDDVKNVTETTVNKIIDKAVENLTPKGEIEVESDIEGKKVSIDSTVIVNQGDKSVTKKVTGELNVLEVPDGSKGGRKSRRKRKAIKSKKIKKSNSHKNSRKRSRRV